MKRRVRSQWGLIITIVLSLITTQVLAADAFYKMAEVMHRLKHFPSPQGMAVLQGIIQDEKVSKNEKIIAQAMLNLQHKVAAEDIPKLKGLIEDASVSQEQRDFANIVLNLNHRPTKSDKQILQAIMDKHK